MIAPNTVASISEFTGTRSCTPYSISIDELEYTVYDTPGLDASGLGTDRVTKLVMGKQDGVNLLIFCMRGRITEDAFAIYKHFSRSLLEKVPVVVVITGLEHEDPMESWWTKNHTAFERYGMSFDGHACVTTIRGKGSIFANQYEESMMAVRNLIATHCLEEGQRAVSSYFILALYGLSLSYKRQETSIKQFVMDNITIIAVIVVATVTVCVVVGAVVGTRT
jgi:hypothetical protein